MAQVVSWGPATYENQIQFLAPVFSWAKTWCCGHLGTDSEGQSPSSLFKQVSIFKNHYLSKWFTHSLLNLYSPNI